MKNKQIDVLIIGEGTYPYIRGGVSTWIHQIIEGIPDLKFGIIFIGGQRSFYGEKKYELPKNVVYFNETYIFEESELPKPKPLKQNFNVYNQIVDIHALFKEIKSSQANLKFLSNIIANFKIEDFLYSNISWEYIKNIYFEKYNQESFIDYLWTVRNIHIPIWNLFNIIYELPEIKLVHSPSTGYAGFLAGLIKIARNTPFILTEHGIYTKERKIDLMTSDWFTERKPFLSITNPKGVLIKNIWNNFFEGLGKFSYLTADIILSLFKKAQEVQIYYGAPKNKTKVIPNGVDIEKFAPIVKKKDYPPRKIIGLIGRIVPIKDIKTFLKAMRLVVNEIQDVEGWIVGPTNEDEAYYNECLNLTKTLNLENNIKFLGFKNVLDVFDKIAINTLTSISEGMPLTILEGFAAGIPAVTTNVGSCKELIFGSLDEEDIKIGQAGFICKVADANCLAKNYIKLLTDHDLWKKFQKAAIQRVTRYYTQDKLISNYREIYEKAFTWLE